MHAPHYTYRGLHMDLELLEWLNSYTFPAESKYKDPEYARETYGRFVDRMVKSATTRACIFGTIHVEATLILMELLEKAGMHTYVGKLNMDRNSPDYLREKSVEQAAADTRYWVQESQKRFQNTIPMLTPRFTPSCSDELMEELRVAGVTDIDSVKYAVLETTGRISVITRREDQPPTSSDLGVAVQDNGLPVIVVSDGRVLTENMKVRNLTDQ